MPDKLAWGNGLTCRERFVRSQKKPGDDRHPASNLFVFCRASAIDLRWFWSRADFFLDLLLEIYASVLGQFLQFLVRFFNLVEIESRDAAKMLIVDCPHHFHAWWFGCFACTRGS